MSEVAAVLSASANAIIDHAEHQRRDLSDFEAGRVDALLDIAEAFRAVERLQAA